MGAGAEPVEFIAVGRRHPGNVRLVNEDSFIAVPGPPSAEDPER